MTSDNTDVVIRLREEGFVTHVGGLSRESKILHEAADEIVHLRQQIVLLRAERDEARREVCSMNETGLRMNESDKKREAKRRGWDCFKETQ